MATLGSLVVTLEANIAKFQSDLGRAVTMAETHLNQISRAVSITSESFKMLAGGLGAYELIGFGSEVLKAAANLEDLKAATGLTIPALSALSNEAAKSGIGVDQAAMSFDRMQKLAGQALGGNKKAEAQFAAIGISAKQLAEDLHDPQKLLLDVAQALEKFNDDGYKTAAMMVLMGKGGAQYNELMHNMAKDGYTAATVMEEQARQAKAFEVALTGLSVRLKAVALDLMTTVVPAIDMVTTTWQMRFANMWINIKAGFDVMVLSFKAGFSVIEGLVQNAKSFLTFGIGGVGTLGAKHEDYAQQILDVVALAQAKKEANRSVVLDEQMHYWGLDPIAISAQRIKPSVPVAPVAKPPKLGSGNDGLIKAMDERLKIISDAMKQEAAVTKLGNDLLDKDYSHGLVSLADYSTQKSALLTKSYNDTQKLYDAQIALSKTYADQIEVRLNKEKAQTVDPSQALQMAAKIASTQAELDLARAKTTGVSDSKLLAGVTYQREQLDLTMKMGDASTALAKKITDVDIAYATLNGDTVLAVRLAQEQSDAVRKQTLSVNELTDSYDKLIALQNDQLLRASQKGLDGMRVAVIDYQKGLADVAKSTASMTTQMLNSMENALVAFVQTGKLNWRSLVDSMIADIARLLIQKQIMGPVANWIGLGLSALGAGAGAGADFGGYTSGQAMGMAAEGGYISVGERGPEKFFPNVSGSVVPNGDSGGMVVNHTTNINIDSRADRSQVMADTRAAVSQGQRDMLLLLKRYNPGLRT